MSDPVPLSEAAKTSGWAVGIREALGRAAERRQRVLAHPDLAQQLTQRPMSYSRPEVWNGYLPPKWGYWGPGGEHLIVNDSPYRAQLVTILTAVAERDQKAVE